MILFRGITRLPFLVLLLGGPWVCAEVPPPPDQWVRCGRLIDPKSGRVESDVSLQILGGRIRKIDPWGKSKPPKGAVVLDAKDMVVMPGLIDVHAHLYGGVAQRAADRQSCNPAVPPFLLAAGVTSAGVPGAMDPEADRALKAKVDHGEIPGPRLFLAGRYLEGEQDAIAWMKPVQSLTEALALVDAEHAAGASAVKIYMHFPRGWIKAVSDRAHGYGMKVWAHLGDVTNQEAMELGVDQINHGLRYAAEARPKVVGPVPRSPQSLPNPEDPRVAQMLKEAGARRVVLTPTLAVGVIAVSEFMQVNLPPQRPYFTPQAWERVQEWNSQGYPGFDATHAKVVLGLNQKFVRKAQAAGCLLATGTDMLVFRQLPGYSLWREMELMAEAGLSPMEVLRAATWHGAIALGAEKDLGSLEVGKHADLVVFQQDPLVDIHNIRTVRYVIKGGQAWDPEKVREPLLGKVR